MLNRVAISLIPVLAITLTPTISHAGPPSNNMQFFGCASEGGTCTISNFVDFLGRQTIKLIAYGDATNSRWVYRNMSGSFSCSNATFGDPDPGTGKACMFAPYQLAGFEGGSFTIDLLTQGAFNVAYGANGSFVYKTLTPGMGTCNDTGVSVSPETFPATTARSEVTLRRACRRHAICRCPSTASSPRRGRH